MVRSTKKDLDSIFKSGNLCFLSRFDGSLGTETILLVKSFDKDESIVFAEDFILIKKELTGNIVLTPYKYGYILSSSYNGEEKSGLTGFNIKNYDAFGEVKNTEIENTFISVFPNKTHVLKSKRASKKLNNTNTGIEEGENQ